MPNGELLDAIEKTIDDALKRSKRLKITEKATLEALRYLIAFSRQSNDDHKKIDIMWPNYQMGRWAILLIIGIGITDIVTRFLGLIGK